MDMRIHSQLPALIICQYLSIPNQLNSDKNEFEWILKCPRCPNNSLNFFEMKMDLAWHSTLKSRIDAIEHGLNVNGSSGSIHSTKLCDECLVGIHSFDYLYTCSNNPRNRHDICTSCAFKFILNHQKMAHLLKNILMDELNDDCIHEIVQFVIGSLRVFSKK